MKTAILGTDLSAASDRIIENAMEFKVFGIKRIMLVFVLNLRSTEDFAEYNLETAQDRLEGQRKQLEHFGYVSETRIVMGLPSNELMKQAKMFDASLVIIGTRGNTWTKTTLGSTASEVLHNMTCPVLLMAFHHEPDEDHLREIKQEELHHFEKFVRQFRKQEPRIELMQKVLNGHVLLTTDFSDFSENAFRWLKESANPVPKLTLMHIQDIVKISKHLENKLNEFNQIDRGRLERLRKEFSQAHPETVIDIVLEYGIPKQLIPQYITDHSVTLAVMGSQGRGYISEFFLGSVSLSVARQTASNVLILPFRKL